MNKHELEARLKQVRDEIASINREGNAMKAELIRQAEERKVAEKEKAKKRAAALARQRSTFWGRTREAFGSRDPAAKTEGGLELLFSVGELAFGSLAGVSKATEMEERRTALQLEEGRILDRLAALPPLIKRELTKPEQREKIYEEMAQRKKEWERVSSHETDEDRLHRLQNLFDEAQARDEDKLRQLL